MENITSQDNKFYKLCQSLLEPKGLKKQGQFLLMGRKLVPEFLAAGNIKFTNLLTSSKVEVPLELSFPTDIKRYHLSPDLFKSLDIFNTRYPLLVGEIPSPQEWDLNSEPKGLELLTALGDPSNLGALLRNAEAFGASSVVLLKESANAFHPKVIRASSGSSLRIPLFTGPSIQEIQGPVVALDMAGTPIQQFKWNKDVRLLLGEEGLGLPKGVGVAEKIMVPMAGEVESLNAVAASSVALYSYRCQFPL